MSNGRIILEFFSCIRILDIMRSFGQVGLVAHFPTLRLLLGHCFLSQKFHIIELGVIKSPVADLLGEGQPILLPVIVEMEQVLRVVLSEKGVLDLLEPLLLGRLLIQQDHCVGGGREPRDVEQEAEGMLAPECFWESALQFYVREQGKGHQEDAGVEFEGQVVDIGLVLAHERLIFVLHHEFEIAHVDEPSHSKRLDRQRLHVLADGREGSPDPRIQIDQLLPPHLGVPFLSHKYFYKILISNIINSPECPIILDPIITGLCMVKGVSFQYICNAMMIRDEIILYVSLSYENYVAILTVIIFVQPREGKEGSAIIKIGGSVQGS